MNQRVGTLRLKEAPLDKVYVSPLCARLDRDPKPLAKSIKSVGLLHPPVVRETPHGYEVIAGARRVEAARQAGLQRITVQIADAESDVEALKIMLAENLERQELKPGELVKAVKMLYDRLGSSRKVAAALDNRIDDSYVRRLLKLSVLEPETIDSLPIHQSIALSDIFAKVKETEPRMLEKERMLREKIKHLSVEESRVVLQAFAKKPDADLDSLIAEALGRQKLVILLPARYIIRLRKLSEQLSQSDKPLDHKELAARIIIDYLDAHIKDVDGDVKPAG